MASYFVAPQQESGFLVLTVPGLPEAIGRGKGGNVVLIDCRTRRSCASAGGQGSGDCQQQKNTSLLQRNPRIPAGDPGSSIEFSSPLTVGFKMTT